MKRFVTLLILLTVTALLASTAWATFNITCSSINTTIPQSGGMVDFTMSVHSTLTTTADIWIGMHIPDGQNLYVYYMWLGTQFSANQTRTKHIMLYASPMWMPGVYMLPIKVGDYYGGQALAQDSMEFNKLVTGSEQGIQPGYPEGTIIATDLGKTPALTLLSVSPQPANPQVDIQYSVTQAGPVNVQIFNLQGSLLYSSQIEAAAPGILNTTLPTATYASGQYFLRLEAGGTVVQRPITILK
jgi:hypothetical protein